MSEKTKMGETFQQDDYNINDYSKYYESNNGSPTDPNTYIINMIGYYYSYGKININQTLYNKSLELVKNSKTFSDTIELFNELDTVLNSINVKDITDKLEVLESELGKDLVSCSIENRSSKLGKDFFSGPIENENKATLSVYGGNPITVGPNFERIRRMIQDNSPNSELTREITHIIDTLSTIMDGPCHVEQILSRLERTPTANTGHWRNGMKIKVDRKRPFQEMGLPSVVTHICAYLWTLHKCSSGSSIYDYVTSAIRSNNNIVINKISGFLTQLYMAIISYKNYDKGIEKTVNFEGEKINIHKNIPTLYRGENNVYNPELLGLSKDLLGKVKWSDVAVKKGNKYVLKDNISTDNTSVFQSMTATSPSLSLAGYFANSSLVDSNGIRVIYKFDNMSGSYAGWFMEVQAFREKEQLVLPGLVVKSKNIKYLHYDDSRRFFQKNPPYAGGTSASGNNVPLLIINLEVIGLTGHLPGLHPSAQWKTMQYLNPYLNNLNKNKCKVMKKPLDQSPSPEPHLQSGLLEHLETISGKEKADVIWDFSFFPSVYTIAATCVCKAMPVFGSFVPEDVYKYAAAASIIYQTGIYVKHHYNYKQSQSEGMAGGNISKFKKLEEISNKLLLYIERIGNIITNFSSKSTGKSKRTKGKKRKTKDKKRKTKGKRGTTKGKRGTTKGKRGKTKGKRGKTKGKRGKTRRK